SAGGGPLMVLADLTALQVRTQVSQVDSQRVQSGQAVSFTLAASPKHVFRGSVSSIAPLSDPSTAGAGYPIILDVDMASVGDVSAPVGAGAAVTIFLAQRYDTLLVPVASVGYAHRVLAGVPKKARKGAASGDLPSTAALDEARASAALLLDEALASGAATAEDAPQADVLVARGKHGWVLKPVVLGLSDGTSIAVLAGLKAGDVVASGQRTLAPLQSTAAPRSARAGEPPAIFGS
ncbi:MAG TPA: efflux RND transporter periplasmic adaptor subunit, partial [Ktedonobacterales bacterium]|nr:efflux RND transporter periplasmic adaptor subunit [Ktedonobacterales bacterium]